MPKNLDERLAKVPRKKWLTLAEIGHTIGTKPSTSLKCRLMLTDGFEARRVIAKESPIANTWRWEFMRYE